MRSFSGLERVHAFPGVVQAEVYFEVGETIRINTETSEYLSRA